MKAHLLTKRINRITISNNKDNITRTNAYKRFYHTHSEIKWTYLASFVSRNAGWSMSDLMTDSLVVMLTNEWRRRLFMTFERINWLIFSDVYPQLLIYEWSKKTGEPCFDKLRYFHVSAWMIKQWWQFWYDNNQDRLLKALIINEQHVIEKPVICAPFFKDALFDRPVYEWQERLHFSIVIFPSSKGELYGTSVKNFTNVKERVILGYKLAWILFESPEREAIRNYFEKQPFTANRSIDIPQLHHVKVNRFPFRLLCPEVLHHDEARKDWSLDKSFQPNLLLKMQKQSPEKYCLTSWYGQKQKQIHVASNLISHVQEHLSNDKKRSFHDIF
ncbi:DUF2515 family protein [Salipaludibacillus daqingensis]|uniref:DUF2515 family protein n=1 Tax=Salipaludibacillus daqingensis TaxID=3041001 RepID=UPI0024732957|nr:DUF2515 family protein [Salipaludibacillus daqingensis]